MRTVSQFLPDARCLRCRGWLLRAEFAPPDQYVPATADYVCVTCGCPHSFQGNPPSLEVRVCASVRG